MVTLILVANNEGCNVGGRRSTDRIKLRV